MTKTALITGASGGIGQAFARIAAGDGYDLILVARSEDKLSALQRELASDACKVTVLPMDLSKPDAAKALKAAVDERGLTVDLLMNNAGFGDASPLLDADWARSKALIDLNVTALVQLSYEFGRGMRERKCGHIINVASIAAFCPGPYMSLYYASKSFVLSFSQALYEELKPFGVTVTAVCLGPAKTGFEHAAGLEKSKMFTFFSPARPEDVARTAYRASMRGKALAFNGAITYVSSFLSRLAPRSTARKFAGYINKLS